MDIQLTKELYTKCTDFKMPFPLMILQVSP